MKNLKKLLRVTFLVLVACYPQAHVAVKNDCNTAWYRVSKLEGSGNYEVAVKRLMPGQRENISLTGTSGQANKFVIMVDGFRLSDDTPLGSATLDLWIDSSDGSMTAPKNNYALNISQVYPHGCPGE